MAEMDSTEAHLHRATPILRVQSLRASVAYYIEALGFRLDWGTSEFVSLTRDACTVFLCEGGQGHAGTWMWIAVKDSDELHAELRARGARIRQRPTNFPWGSRELQVTDPDGHVLRFASEATEEPCGEFSPDRSDG